MASKSKNIRDQRGGRDRRMVNLGPPALERRAGKDRRQKIKIPIFVKFVVLSTLLTIIISSIISGVILKRQSDDFREQLITMGRTLIRIIADQAPDKLLNEEDLVLFQLVQDVATEDQVAFALITDVEGIIRADSRSERINTPFQMPPGYRDLQEIADTRIGMFERPGETYLYFEKPITFQDIPVGKVALAISQQQVRQNIAGATRYIVVVTALIILLGVFMSLLVSLYFSKPIDRLMYGIRAILDGDYDHQVQVNRNDELGDVGNAFNQMAQGLKERQIMRRSLELAMEVQRSLLPSRVPQIEDLDIAGKSIYCDETGGDYYDFIDTGEQGLGKIGLVLGDVSGHGIPSALLMATARAFIRQRSYLAGSIAEVVSDVNHLLTQDVENSSSFMTLFYLSIDMQERCLHWVRAGHDPAIYYDPENDRFDYLVGKGVPLGVDGDWAFEENQRNDLRPGQIIVIGTDGIWETRNAEGVMFSKTPVLNLIRRNREGTAHQILEAIIEGLDRFRRGVELEDDVTLLVIKIGPFHSHTATDQG
ncbi:MAG: SpoIIE family protein phosphatase [Desulfosarcina sp.]|nr:SpoIIE family protein phosphatase [Desulfobacterales bacterium]